MHLYCSRADSADADPKKRIRSEQPFTHLFTRCAARHPMPLFNQQNALPACDPPHRLQVCLTKAQTKLLRTKLQLASSHTTLYMGTQDIHTEYTQLGVLSSSRDLRLSVPQERGAEGDRPSDSVHYGNPAHSPAATLLALCTPGRPSYLIGSAQLARVIDS